MIFIVSKEVSNIEINASKSMKLLVDGECLSCKWVPTSGAGMRCGNFT